MSNRRNLPERYRGGIMSPIREISRLQRGIDRLFEDFGIDQDIAFVPPVEVEESGDHFVFRFDLPGVSRNDLNIEIRDNQLILSGERKIEPERGEGTRLAGERIYGSFLRSFTLPTAVDADRIDARFRDGVLTVTVPKSETAKPKLIEIKEGGQEKKIPQETKVKKGEAAA